VIAIPAMAISAHTKARLLRIWRWCVRVPQVRAMSRATERRTQEVAAVRREIKAMTLRTERPKRR
jgi:HAMP domain-containing protein